MFKSPRGTADILPEEQEYWRYVESKAEELCALFGYGRIETPVFEDADLFVRSVGQETDIVEKEMYTFPDRGGQMLALRPEGTVGVCRAYLEHGMSNRPQPVRLYYFSPVFRYERPQAGRYRQHHQFGAEVLGDGSATVDAEVIELACGFMDVLGLKDTSLVVNSIGDRECRPGYVEELKAYYQGKEAQLCSDCRVRLERSPLRLLDDKRESCQAVASKAPRSTDHLCGACREHWQLLRQYLDLLGISYRVDHRLVRGLDYYTRTVFEIQPQEEGSQSTILAGGRYDGLIEELGGRPTPGIGFGTGMERLILNLKRQGVQVQQKPAALVVLTYTAQEALERALGLARLLRREGVSAVLAPSGKSLKAQMRYATAVGATHTVILGEDELRKGNISLKEMGTGDQREVDEATLVQQVK